MGHWTSGGERKHVDGEGREGEEGREGMSSKREHTG